MKYEEAKGAYKNFVIVMERGESYKDKYFSILNKLDFQNEQSYKDANSKTFGDINKDGKVDTIKNEPTI